MSAPVGPRLSWTAFAAVMVPFLLVIGMWMSAMVGLLSRLALR